MRIGPFEMERWQSTYDMEVAYNLSESGVLPVTLHELVEPLDADWIEEVLGQTSLGYGHTRGSPALLEAIAAQYRDADPSNVLVTIGTAEANFLATWWLVEPGDEVVVMLPNYMQIHGLVPAFGGVVRPWWLRREDGWRPDLDALSSLVSPRTKAIAVCNPNNPTGMVLRDEEMDAIVDAAERSGAWVLADEVYRGAELSGGRTPSFWGRYDHVLVTCGLSKAYGLPGLRTGWIVAPPSAAEVLCAHHDYTTIGPPLLSDLLARVALTEPMASRLAARTRRILTSNLKVLAAWVGVHERRISWTPPEAGAIAMLRYALSQSSAALAERLRTAHDVLVVPGDHFSLEGYIRLGYGGDPRQLEHGLQRIGSALVEHVISAP